MLLNHMREIPRNPLPEIENPIQAVDERAQFVLGKLGLTEDNLRNKTVIDVGSGSRELAAYCLLHNISDAVYSLERESFTPPNEHKDTTEDFPNLIPQLDAKTVMGTRNSLPFQENSFDILVNHASMPAIDDLFQSDASIVTELATDRILPILKETVRVLKPGGKAYFYPLRREILPDRREREIKFLNTLFDELRSQGHMIDSEDIPQKKIQKDGTELNYTMSRVIITKADNTA